MARPVIGIPCYAGQRAGTLRPFYGNNRAYCAAIEQAGGTPVLIPHFHDLTALEPLCARLDGLLLPGGADIHPQHYGADAHPLLGEVDEHEDRLDLALAQYFLEMNLPILGICRGVQLLNVATRGTLYQDILDERPASQQHAVLDQPRSYRAHPISITPGTRLAELIGAEPLLVNSLHHQAVKTTGRQVIVSANAPDGVVEGIEVPNHRFAVGVQCHPEELVADGDERALRLFRGFIQAAARASRWAEPRPSSAADR